MKFVREHKLVSIIVLCVSTLFLFVTVAFGRYIKNIINNYLLEAKSFYFNSTVLGINGKNYSIVNWDGVNSYPLTIDINNRKNALRHTDADIVYTVTANCPTTVSCTLSKNGGTLYADDETDSYVLTVTPLQNFYEGDTVTVSTTVLSSSPYQKQMSATYTIGVQKSNFSYNIEDSVNSKYLTLNLVNSITFYEVLTAFGDYAVGDHVSLDEYSQLAAIDKAKCLSAEVTLEYDPHDLLVDMTNLLYLNRLNTGYQETTINNFQYVSKFRFRLNAASSNSIIFYKDDVTQNYTYPSGNNSPVITVSVNTAN